MKKIFVFVVVCLFTSVCGVSFAKDNAPKAKAAKEPVVNTLVKQVEGEVSNITQRSISIVYDRNTETGEESEMLFTIDAKNIKVEHKSSLDQISQGDTVLVIYSEETSDYGDRKATKIKTDVIRFLKPADAQSVYKPKAAATEEAQDIEGLSLKGVK